jgi:drug/metabolite transporter (DMT)-like permease
MRPQPAADIMRTRDITKNHSPADTAARLPYIGLLALLVLTWAVSWPLIKIGVSVVPPIWFGVSRYTIATALVFTVLACTRGCTLPPRSDWPLILVSGALQMAAYAALTAYALLTLPPGRASVLAFSTPLWVVPLAAAWLGEQPTARKLFGVFVGIAGIVTIAAPALQLGDTSYAKAYLALVAASLAWAISIVAVRRHTFVASAFALAPWQMLTATLLLLPVALAFEGPLPALNTTAVATLAFVGPISTGFAYWAVVEVGRHFHATTIAMALLATPSLGIMISALMLDEVIDGQLMAGVGFVGLGIWLATRQERTAYL